MKRLLSPRRIQSDSIESLWRRSKEVACFFRLAKVPTKDRSYVLLSLIILVSKQWERYYNPSNSELPMFRTKRRWFVPFLCVKAAKSNSKTTRWLSSKVEKWLVVGYRYRCLRYPSSLTRRARRERSCARRATRKFSNWSKKPIITTSLVRGGGSYEQYEIMVYCSSRRWSCCMIESFVAYWTWLIKRWEHKRRVMVQKDSDWAGTGSTGGGGGQKRGGGRPSSTTTKLVGVLVVVLIIIVLLLSKLWRLRRRSGSRSQVEHKQ